MNVIIIGIMVTCVAGPRPGQCRHWRCWKVETGVFVGITPWCPVVPRPADICSATGQCAALLPIQTAGAGQGGGPLARLLLLHWFCWLNWISILPSQHEMYDVWYKICEDCYIKALTFKTKTQLLSISMWCRYSRFLISSMYIYFHSDIIFAISIIGKKSSFGIYQAHSQSEYLEKERLWSAGQRWGARCLLSLADRAQEADEQIDCQQQSSKHADTAFYTFYCSSALYCSSTFYCSVPAVCNGNQNYLISLHQCWLATPGPGPRIAVLVLVLVGA